MRMPRLLIGILTLAFCAALLGGCGKKAWPEPRQSDDVFAFENATATLENGYLNITADVSGKWKKIAHVYLEISGAECPGCPFAPTERIEYTTASKELTLAGGKLRLVVGGFGDKPLLWRIKADNVHTSIRGAETAVQMVP